MGVAAAVTGRGGAWVAAQGALFLGLGAALALTGSTPPAGARIAGWTLSALGLGTALWASAALGRNLTPFPQPRAGTELVDRGPFAVVRHPIYSGLGVTAAGLALADGNVWAGLAAAALVVLFAFKSGAEERLLVEQVAGYADYRRRVRWRLFPMVV